MTDAADELASTDLPYEPPTAEHLGPPPPPAGTILTAAHVREKTFTSTRFKPGYDEDEVDAFLDEVEHTLDRLHSQLAALPPPSGSDPALPVIAPPVAATTAAANTEMEEMLRRTLLLAQKTADQAVAEARAQADQTLADARAEATRVVTDARGRAEAAEREAAVRSTAMLSESDSQRRSIEAKVEALRSFEREYRSRLRGYFELQLRELEGVGPAGPGAPAPAPAAPAVFIPSDGTTGGAAVVGSTTVGPSAPPVPGASGVATPPSIAAAGAGEPAETTVADGSGEQPPAAE